MLKSTVDGRLNAEKKMSMSLRLIVISRIVIFILKAMNFRAKIVFLMMTGKPLYQVRLAQNIVPQKQPGLAATFLVMSERDSFAAWIG